MFLSISQNSLALIFSYFKLILSCVDIFATIFLGMLLGELVCKGFTWLSFPFLKSFAMKPSNLNLYLRTYFLPLVVLLLFEIN